MADIDESKRYWADYDRVARTTADARGQQRTPESEHFERFGYWRGDLCRQWVERGRELFFRDGRFTTFAPNEFADGYINSAAYFTPEVVAGIDAGNRFRRPDATFSWFVQELLAHLKQPVIRVLQSPWRVLMTRCTAAPAGAPELANLAWHNDGFSADIFKILIYFTPLSLRTGTVALRPEQDEIVLESEAAGSWLLFKNSAVTHRGIAPSAGQPDRILLEVTISRAIRCDVAPRFVGINSHWPSAPWIAALDAAEPGLARKAVGSLSLNALPASPPPKTTEPARSKRSMQLRHWVGRLFRPSP